MFLDRTKAAAAVRARARKNDASRTRSEVAGERFEEIVDRAAHPARVCELGQAENALLDRQAETRRDHVDVIDLHPFPALDLPDGHGSVSLDKLRHQRFMVRIEVLYDHEGHARIAGEAAQHFAQSLEPAGRGADAHDRKIGFGACRSGVLRTHVHRG